MELNDFFAMMTIFPGGLVFGFYLCQILAIYPNQEYEFDPPILTTPLCALLISYVIKIKKQIQQKYTFDNLYWNSFACCFYIVSGFFFLRKSFDIALYFGFVGSGIAFISSLTYVGFRAASTRYRHMRVAGLNLVYFIGITVGAGIDSFYQNFDEALGKCGLILLGTAIFLLGALICNHILHYCNLNNYRTSYDELWNYFNTRKWLYRNRPETLAIFGRVDNKFKETHFVIVKSRESLTIFFIFLLMLMNFMAFCNISLTTGLGVNTVYFKWGGIFGFMLAATGGIAFSALLLTVLSPRSLYMLFSIVKCAILLCILVFFEMSATPQQFTVYYLVYFFCIGVIYTTPIAMLLEVAGPRDSEIIISFAYCVQILLWYTVMYLSVSNFNSNSNLHLFVRSLFIAYAVFSFLVIFVVQSFAPIEGSLIKIRNHLIGIRKAQRKTVVYRY